MQYILYIANFLFLLNQDTRKLIRNIENIEKKLINCQVTVVTKTCLNENIYINIFYISEEKCIVIYARNFNKYTLRLFFKSRNYSTNLRKYLTK